MNTQNLRQLEAPEVVNASGVLALFLQFAHPLVAAGVNSTGEFYKNSRQRLHNTSQTLAALTNGDQAEVHKLSSRIQRRHARISGMLSEDVGSWQKGTPYNAADPSLLLWVYATLVISRIIVFSELVRSLSEVEKQRYYESTYLVGEWFGVTADIRPALYSELVEYFQTTSCTLAVGKDGNQLIDSLLNGLGWLAVFVKPCILGLLPVEIRVAYGFPWNWRRKFTAKITGILFMKVLALCRIVRK